MTLHNFEIRISEEDPLNPAWENLPDPYKLGALDGGPQCHMSILRNNNVPCRYLCNYPVDFKIA